MSEACYNFFLNIENDSITAIGVVVHHLDGTDDEKLRHLQSRVNHDCHAAHFYLISEPIPWGIYTAMHRIGSHQRILEPILAQHGASSEPLMVVTTLIDGYPSIKVTTDLGPLKPEVLESINPHPWSTPDYLAEYVKDGVFDIPRLLNDDHVEAIRILFNKGMYISAAKLLVSLIDTISYIEYGDIKDPFTKWLDRYCKVEELGVTSVEIREFRHSILHMTNLSSRSVIAGKVPRLVPYVSADVSVRQSGEADFKYLNLWALMQSVSRGISTWIETHNMTRDKFLVFIARYDEVVSDSRMSVFRDRL